MECARRSGLAGAIVKRNAEKFGIPVVGINSTGGMEFLDLVIDDDNLMQNQTKQPYVDFVIAVSKESGLKVRFFQASP